MARKFWTRRYDTGEDTAEYPVRSFPMPDAIHKVSFGLDPRRPDLTKDQYHPDVFQSLFHAGQDPETVRRQEQDIDSDDRGRHEFDKHMTEGLWVLHTGVGLSRYGMAPKTEQFTCGRCGYPQEDRTGKKVPKATFPFYQKVCKDGCKDWNTENSPHGARRRVR